MKFIYTFFLFHLLLLAQGQKLIVQDSVGNPLAGVAVYSDDFAFAQSTDIKGVIDLNDQIKYPLNFEYLGYEDISITEAELKALNFIVSLQESKLIMEEIVLIGRTDIAQQDLAYESSIVPRAEIQLSNSQTSADALGASSEVYIQKSQMGGGSPIIRGFEANKLLLVVDGVRMNNAIYRGGHLQNAITIDPAILENMEVIFGPGSLMYGSDALGGVIHFQSKSLELTPKTIDKTEGSYYTRYGSSNHEISAHADASVYKKKWAFLSSVSASRFADLTIGKNRASKYPENYGLRPTYVEARTVEDGGDVILTNDPNILKSTGYSQLDLLQKIRFQPSKNLSFVLNTQYSNSTDIPRYDALTESSNGNPRYSIWNYGPQKRFLTSLSTKYVPTNNRLFDKIQFILAYQNIDEIRITKNFGSPILEEQNENLQIVNTTLDLSKILGSHQWYVGLDGNYNSLESVAYQSTFGQKDKTEAGLTRYPNGDNNTQSVGIYAQYYFIPTDKKYKINTGIRYDYNRVYTQFEQDNIFTWPSFFYDGVSNQNQAINWSIGWHYQLPKNFNLRALAGSSFRAPNIDDLAKIRLKNDEISIPNTALIPEKSLNGELSLNYRTHQTEIGATGFYTYLSDAIVRENFSLPNGNTSYITNGDTFNIVANINADNAIISGMSITLEQAYREYWSVRASMTFTKGDIISEANADSPLAHIPPSYAKAFVQYNRNKFLSRIGFRYNAKKDISRYGGTTDNPEFATSEGSLSWYTLHFTSQYQFSQYLQVQVGIDNILDQFYIPFASGVPGAGRHFTISMKGNF